MCLISCLKSTTPSPRWRLGGRQGTTNCPVRGAKAGRGPNESSSATLTAGGGGPRHLPLRNTSHIDAPPLALNFWPWRLMRTLWAAIPIRGPEQLSPLPRLSGPTTVDCTSAPRPPEMPKGIPPNRKVPRWKWVESVRSLAICDVDAPKSWRWCWCRDRDERVADVVIGV